MSHQSFYEQVVDLKIQLAAVTKERDELKEMLANCEAWARRTVTTEECVFACEQIAREASAVLQEPQQ